MLKGIHGCQVPVGKLIEKRSVVSINVGNPEAGAFLLGLSNPHGFLSGAIPMPPDRSRDRWSCAHSWVLRLTIPTKRSYRVSSRISVASPVLPHGTGLLHYRRDASGLPRTGKEARNSGNFERNAG